MPKEALVLVAGAVLEVLRRAYPSAQLLAKSITTSY
jgi:hypothetical protein